jgi:uncharacterized protein
MSPDNQREIASKGGKSVPADKRSFFKNVGLAAEAGSKGSKFVDGAKRTFTTDHDLASRADKVSGLASKNRKRRINSSIRFGSPPS